MTRTSSRALLLLTLGVGPGAVAQSPTPVERLRAPLGLSVSEAFRLGFTATGAGARAMGMGGAFIAVADDGTAASFNPAGLAQLRAFEVSIVGRKSTFDLELGADADYKSSGYVVSKDRTHGSSPAAPQFLSLAMPFTWDGKNVVVQMSRQRVFEMNLDYHRSWYAESPTTPGQYRSLDEQVSQKGDLVRWNLAAALEASPRLLVGAAWNQWRGRWDLQAGSFGFQPAPRLGSARRSSASLNQTSSLEGRNWALGLLWRSEDWRVGMAYQTPFTAKFRYSGYFSGAVETNMVRVLEGPIEVGGHTYEVHWPETLAVGLSYRPHPQWQVALDWSRTPWDKARMSAPGQIFDGQNVLDPAPQDQTVGPGYPGPGQPVQAKTVRLGVEHLLLVRTWVVPLRAGIFSEPQPLRDPITGENRVLRGFTLGTGLKAGNLTVDLAWRLGRSHRMIGTLTTPLSLVDKATYGDVEGVASERITTRELVASLIFQFKGEGVRKAFRWLFVSGE